MDKKESKLGLDKIKKIFEKEIIKGRVTFHTDSIRSGNKVEAIGSLVVLGDVNFGAEIFASENIVVLGILRGIAHAGATGNTKAIVSAMKIQSPQIRIANIVKQVEENDDGISAREIARIEAGEIVIIK